MQDPVELHIQALQRHIALLQQRAADQVVYDPVLLQESLSQLQSALEEMLVVQEELLSQHEELIVAQHQSDMERRRYQDLFDQAPDSYVITDQQGIIHAVNHAVTLLLDQPGEALVQQSMSQFIDAAWEQEFLGLLERLPAADGVVTWEAQLRRAAGTLIDIDARVVPVRDVLTGEIMLRWLLRDITARKQIERVVHFQVSLLHAVDAAVMATDLDGRIVFWNRFAERMYGWQASEVLGKPILDVTPAELLSEQAQSIMGRVLAGGNWSGEFVVRRRDGTPFPALVTDAPIYDRSGTLIGIVGVSHDLTERKRAEAALHESEERYRALADLSPDALWVDLDGHLVYANPAAARLLHASGPEELIGLSPLDVIESDYRTLVGERSGRSVGDKGAATPVEQRWRRLDGSIVDVEVAGGGVPWQGRLAIQVIFRDITERKQLIESLSRMASIVESSDDAITSTTLDGTIVTWNRAAEHLTGLPAAQALSRSITILVDPDLQGEILSMLKRIGRGERIAHFETTRPGPNQRRIDVSLSISPVQDAVGTIIGASVIARDITELKRAERVRRLLMDRLVSAQEAEQRRLSQELHDEAGRSLTALQLGLAALSQHTRSDPAAEAQLTQLQELVSTLGRDLHTIARQLRPAALDDQGLCSALENYLEEWAARYEMAVALHCPDSLDDQLLETVKITIYRVVQEALTNIARHARARHVSVILERRRQDLRLIVEDDGNGFDAESLLATPESSSGLGLIGMQERVAALGGTLTIESFANHGTTIFVRVPLGGESEARHDEASDISG